jgi:tetratricopeptide (TPR) repeat protein
MGDAHFFLGDYEKAIEVSQLAIHQDPSMFGARVTLACANARLGRKAEARRHIDHLVNDIPRFSVQAVRKNPIFVDPRLVDDMIESLRIAGLPEEAPARAAP